MSPARNVLAAIALTVVACTDVSVAPETDFEPAFASEDLPLNLDDLPSHRRRCECLELEPGEEPEDHSRPHACVENPHRYTSRRCLRTAYPLASTPNTIPLETPIPAHSHGIHEMTKR